MGKTSLQLLKSIKILADAKNSRQYKERNLIEKKTGVSVYSRRRSFLKVAEELQLDASDIVDERKFIHLKTELSRTRSLLRTANLNVSQQERAPVRQTGQRIHCLSQICQRLP